MCNQNITLILAMVIFVACGSTQTLPDEPLDDKLPRSDDNFSPFEASDGQCPDAKPVPACADVSSTAISTTDFLKQRESLVGQTIQVRGILSAGPPLGTSMACPPELPCCNRCRSGLTLLGANLELRSKTNSSLLSCSGDGCNLCCGFVVPTADVIVTGKLTKPNQTLFVMEGVELCALP